MGQGSGQSEGLSSAGGAFFRVCFYGRAHVRLEEEKKDLVAVWLKPKNEKQDLQKLALEFSDELLNYAHYFSSLKINAENMKILLQRALFSASPSIVKEAEDKEIENLIKELEAEEKQGDAEGKDRTQGAKITKSFMTSTIHSSILPFNAEKINDKYLVTNMMGCWDALNEKEFRQLQQPARAGRRRICITVC